MKQLFTIFLFGTLHFLLSCNSDDSSGLSKEENKKFQVNREELLKDFTTWYTYTYRNIKLSQDFAGLNVDSGIIKKSDFLSLLSTGNFVPVKIMIKDSLPFYKLYGFISPNLDIHSTIKQMALTEIEHLEMEGKELPAYSFTDLNGKTYNESNTKGKIIILKCWFIHCVACVKEFPELNKLVDEYKNRSDIQFVSLATDSKEKLTLFLKTKEFKYAVVPEQEKFMSEQLHITSYPTHILIGKDGKIVKVVNSIDELTPFIKK